VALDFDKPHGDAASRALWMCRMCSLAAAALDMLQPPRGAGVQHGLPSVHVR
jgi:hypothetical protein